METKLLNGVFNRMPIHQKLDPEMLTLFGITKSPADLAAAEINKRYEEIERQRHRKRAQESD